MDSFGGRGQCGGRTRRGSAVQTGRQLFATV
ncbi:hypothetical protein A2U01_0055638, partial [Trifolium medium]|nr:hypothetical protein [Trifolium medium]